MKPLTYAGNWLQKQVSNLFGLITYRFIVRPLDDIIEDTVAQAHVAMYAVKTGRHDTGELINRYLKTKEELKEARKIVRENRQLILGKSN